jgi:hypothetical protein
VQFIHDLEEVMVFLHHLDKERLKIDLAKSEERYFRGEKERLEMLSEISEKNKKLAQKDKKIAQLQKILLENNIII